MMSQPENPAKGKKKKNWDPGIPASSPALLKHPAAKLPANAISESWSAMCARIPLELGMELPEFSRKMIWKWRTLMVNL